MDFHFNIKQFPALLAVCTGLLFASCDRGELPVPKHQSGDVQTAEVDMGSDYHNQIFYDLVNNQVVSTNDKTAWDLGFETKADGYHIVLNTANFMFAYKTNATDLSQVTDTNGFEAGKKWDEVSGNLDSTAIGDWTSGNHVYIINRGQSASGTALGFRKIQIESVDASSYKVHYANIDGSDDHEITIPKDENYNFSFLSFGTNSTVSIEPPKADWDLEFTQYTYIFYDQNPILPYLVTGCLINRNNVSVAIDSVNSFTAITADSINNYTFNSNVDVIGYDWKVFDGTKYTVDINTNYIIKTRDGSYYKLHFINFYSNTGTKGVPTWEYQQL